MMTSKKALLVAFLMGTALIVLAAVAGSQWGAGARIASMIYAGLVTLFLVAQIYGFVVSQTEFSDSVEDSKFQVLDVEGVTCKIDETPA
jgi:hypothetical protein